MNAFPTPGGTLFPVPEEMLLNLSLIPEMNVFQIPQVSLHQNISKIEELNDDGSIKTETI